MDSTFRRFRVRLLSQELGLTAHETLFGRGEECHVTLFDPLVSRVHARIVVEGSCAFLEDLGSRNGTFVGNQHVLGLHALVDGDIIRLGRQELTFVDAQSDRSEPAGTAPPPQASRAPPPSLSSVATIGEGDERAWEFGLLCDLAVRAYERGRFHDAARIHQNLLAKMERSGQAGVLEVAQARQLARLAGQLGPKLAIEGLESRTASALIRLGLPFGDDSGVLPHPEQSFEGANGDPAATGRAFGNSSRARVG